MKAPEWIPEGPWAGFVEMRKKIKKPMTDAAAKLIFKKLEGFRDAGQCVATILNNSIENSWQSVFEERERRTEARPGQRSALPQLGKHGQATANNAQDWLESQGMDDTLEEKRRFASLITGLSDYYKSEVSRAVLGIYWEGLKHFSYEAIEKACWAHTQLPDEAGRWMPRNSDIIKMIEGNTVDQAAQAWSKVDQAIRVRGTWDDVIFDDAIIHRVIADMGGWVALGSKGGDEWPFVGKEFQTRYRSFRSRGVAVTDYPARLTGMANAHNASNNQPLLPPILIGDGEKAKQVFKRGSGASLLGMMHANDAARGLFLLTDGEKE